jgi:hypothetical protein
VKVHYISHKSPLLVSSVSQINLLEFSGSHGSENEDGCPLGCCTVQSGSSLPTFQRRLLRWCRQQVSLKRLWTIELPEYKIQYPRRQSSWNKSSPLPPKIKLLLRDFYFYRNSPKIIFSAWKYIFLKSALFLGKCCSRNWFSTDLRSPLSYGGRPHSLCVGQFTQSVSTTNVSWMSFSGRITYVHYEFLWFLVS